MAGSRRGWLTLAVLSLACVSTGVARGAEVTRLVSAFDGDNRFDFNLTVAWLHTQKSAFIKREGQATPTSNAELLKDLQYKQTRDVLNLRADFGLFRDVGFHIEAPIVLRDDRTLSFDQSLGGDCHYPGDLDPNGNPYDPTCVDSTNSQILGAGILPSTPDRTRYGIDSAHPDRHGFTGSDSTIPAALRGPTVFRGPTRAGIEYLGFGLTWAPFSQARDDTKPTWTLGADARLDVGKDMRYDPANPDANTAVGLGYHQLIFKTAVSKRFKYFEPYFDAWYNLPIRSSGSPYGSYPYAHPGVVPPASVTMDPQQRAGFSIGVEQIAWEDPHASQRVTVEFRGHVEEHFFGASQSELWEPLSGHPGCVNDATAGMSACRPNIDTTLNGAAMPYPGVTETQAYASFGGDAGVNIQVGKHIRFRGLFGLTIEQPHFITYANAGRDLPPYDAQGNRVAGPPNGVNLADPAERNPVYRETFDTPGRRFKVEGTQIWSLLIEGSLMF